MSQMRLLLLALLTLCFRPAVAQEAQVFFTGEQNFHYSQLFGPFNGDFTVEGEIDTTQWIPTLTEGIGGAIAAMDSTGAEQLLTLAVKTNVDVDTTWHVFGVLYRAAGTIVEGTVPNASSAVQFFLLWNLDSLALPTELPDSLDIQEILGALSAEHKFIGAATAMNITHRDSTTLNYTFSGMAVDMDNTSTIITITGGSTQLQGFVMSAVEPLQPRQPSLDLRLSPNPFNPDTEMRFALSRPGEVELRVHDMQGRLVQRKVLGSFGVGDAVARWHGGGRPSGSYMLSLWQQGSLVAQGRAVLLK